MKSEEESCFRKFDYCEKVKYGLHGLSCVSKLHNHEEDYWLDRCPQDSHWHPWQGGEMLIAKEAGYLLSTVSNHTCTKIVWK